MTHSLVYFLSAPSVSRVKIGFTADLPTRFMQLQSSCPVKLTIMGCIPGDSTQENQLHQRFSAWRNDFEWFTLTESVHKDILEILAGSEAALTPRRFAGIREWIRCQISEAYNIVEDHKMTMSERAKKRYEAVANGPVCKTANFLVTKEKLDLTGIDIGTMPPKRAVR